MKKTIILLILNIGFLSTGFSQDEIKEIKLSLQTDLLAYTTLGGWSAWATAQYKQNKLSIAYVNYPNRYRSIYEETDIKENARWVRFQLSRHLKPTSKLKNFFYGLNIEHHWRELEEDNNPDEILNDTHWQLGVFLGYEWQPWRKKENAMHKIFITPWLGANYLPTFSELGRVFENTASIYDIPNLIRPTVGVNIGYTFYNN